MSKILAKTLELWPCDAESRYDADAHRRARRCDAESQRDQRRRRLRARRDLVAEDLHIWALAWDWRRTGAQLFPIARGDALATA